MTKNEAFLKAKDVVKTWLIENCKEKIAHAETMAMSMAITVRVADLLLAESVKLPAMPKSLSETLKLTHTEPSKTTGLITSYVTQAKPGGVMVAITNPDTAKFIMSIRALYKEF